MVGVGLPTETSPSVRPSVRPEFGDYQANGVMRAAKVAGENPRNLAKKILAAADLSDLVDLAEIAGPGFINLHLKKVFIAKQLSENDSKRTSTWKKVVLAPYLDKSLDYKDLSTLGDNFQKTLNENTKFSRTEKFSIESALHLNKNKGSTVAKALLDRFYEESEPFFKQKINYIYLS